MSHSSTWPPSHGLTTKRVSREASVFTMYGSTTIKAPAALVFDKITRASTYPTWNTFIPKKEILSQPPTVDSNNNDPASDPDVVRVGTRFKMHVVMNPAKPNSLIFSEAVVTDISTPEKPSSYVPAAMLETDGSFTSDLSRVYRACWTADQMMGGLRAERVSEVIVLGDRECEVHTWELQTGVMTYVVKAIFGKTLMDRFEDWCRGLKTCCEKEVGSTAN